jgi:hypothetical protein
MAMRAECGVEVDEPQVIRVHDRLVEIGPAQGHYLFIVIVDSELVLVECPRFVVVAALKKKKTKKNLMIKKFNKIH